MIETKRLRIVLRSPDETRAFVAGLSPQDRAQVSPAWLERVTAATVADPWIHGFALVLRETGSVIGSAGFKAPPGPDRAVEIAYGVSPEREGNGYATEAAAALAAWALDSGKVDVVRAHTVSATGASARVLAKCGFRNTGLVTDTEDGPVWRWEKTTGGAR